MRKKQRHWPAAENAIGTILMKDRYANFRLHHVSRIMTVVISLVLISLIGTVILISRPPQYRYVLTDVSGKVLPLVPLDSPNHQDDFIVEWTIDAVTRLYSFDFVNYRNQFQEAKGDMTTVGWKNFEKAMDISGNFRSVVGNRYVTTAVPTGPGRVTKTGQLLGRHAWKVEFPMLISYRSSQEDDDGRQRVTNQQLNVAVTVARQPEYLNKDGLGIRAIVAE